MISVPHYSTLPGVSLRHKFSTHFGDTVSNRAMSVSVDYLLSTDVRARFAAKV